MAPQGNPGQPDLGQAGRVHAIQQLADHLVELLEIDENNFQALNNNNQDAQQNDGQQNDGQYNDEYYAQFDGVDDDPRNDGQYNDQYDNDDDYDERHRNNRHQHHEQDDDQTDYGDLAPEDKGQPDPWPYSRGSYYGYRS